MFSLHVRCINADALSPTAWSIDDAFSLPTKCTGAISRAKNVALRPFSKVDEVVVYPYYLVEVAFGF